MNDAEDKNPVKLERITRIVGRIRRADGITPEELDYLRKNAPRLYEIYGSLLNSNRKLGGRLARDRELLKQAAHDREIVEALTSPPLLYGILHGYENGRARVNVAGSNEHLLVAVHPGINPDKLVVGREVLLEPESRAIIDVREYPRTGLSARVKELLPDDRIVVTSSMGSGDNVVRYSGDRRLKVGELVLVERGMTLASETLPREDRQEFYLERIPNVRWSDIGGLDKEIQQLQQMVEYPYLYPEFFAKYSQPPGKGVLLHGPPGCGKTLLVKALANEMFEKRKDGSPPPVLVFFDEADSLFGVRGTGVLVEGGGGSTMNDTIVPQLLAELDGLEELNGICGENYDARTDARPFFYHIGGPEILTSFVGKSEEAIRDIYRRAREKSNIVITILATNRPDRLDPAVIRERRIDKKVRIPRPNEAGAKYTLGIYIPPNLPIDATELEKAGSYDAWRNRTIEQLVQYLFHSPDSICSVEYKDGRTRELSYSDLISGSKLYSIVQRAKELAIVREVQGVDSGLRNDDFVQGVADSYAEEVDILTSGSPQKWSQILGKEGDSIMRIRPSPKYFVSQPQATTYKPRSSAV